MEMSGYLKTTEIILAAVTRGLETAAAIRDATGFQRATVSARLSLLASQGKIECFGEVPSPQIPRAKLWRVKSASPPPPDPAEWLPVEMVNDPAWKDLEPRP
jgi:hypothetical protein